MRRKVQPSNHMVGSPDTNSGVVERDLRVSRLFYGSYHLGLAKNFRSSVPGKKENQIYFLL